MSIHPAPARETPSGVPGATAVHSDIASAATGGAGLTAPLWLQYVDPVLQAMIAAMGFSVLVLTVWNKWLEIRIKRRALHQPQGAENADAPEE